MVPTASLIREPLPSRALAHDSLPPRLNSAFGASSPTKILMAKPLRYDVEGMLSGGDRNIFHIGLNTYRVVTPDQLYGENKELVKGVIADIDTRLYVISRIPKMRFDVGSCRVGLNFNVKGRLRFSTGKALKFDASMARFWRELPELYETFPSDEQLAEYFLEYKADFSYFSLLPTRLKYRLFSYIDRASSTGAGLVVKCALSHVISDFRVPTIPLPPHRVANLCDLGLGDYPEVLYIGISNAGVYGRVTHHQKLQEILAVNDDDHEIIIHLLSLDHNNIRFTPCEGAVYLLTKDKHSGISIEDQTEMAETALIKYFKPKYNEKKTKQEVASNEKVKRKLIKNGYSEILCELHTEGVLSRLGTGDVPCSNSHTFAYDLTGS